ncbi:hypothetical protein D9758_011351 [Tetrapyrgos nigripes]|uniref:Thioesterase domain-containing protein n=1 Tax=Tetrapyrgos nigripes TaxID=182062 RepID=A0A8H5LJU1_9AGAR|nr:hypothetical protein D9758_011351 [Tetrapyrgos nigripes]
MTLSRLGYRNTIIPLKAPLHARTFASTVISHRPRRTLLTLGFSAVASLTAYTIGSVYPPPALSYIYSPYSRSSSSSSSVIQSTPSFSPSELDSIESQLLSLPLLQELRSSSSSNEYYLTRPYSSIPEERRVNNLTAGALRGPGRLAVPPVVWAKKDESEAFVFVHVGRGLCGHDGIVHGGLLATLVDESLGRQAITNLPDRIGVTATLNLSYRAPTKADQFIVIKTKLDRAKGRKVFVSARVEDLNGTLLVEASGMFVQPRYAKLLNSTSIQQAIGEPPSSPTASSNSTKPEPLHLADGEKLDNLRKEK